MKISLKKVNLKAVLVVIMVISILAAALAVNFLFLQGNKEDPKDSEERWGKIEKRVAVCEKQIAALKAELEASQKVDDKRRAFIINKIRSFAIRLALVHK